MNSNNSLFKLIAYIEGVSNILLMCVAMPIKYIFLIPEAVKYPGWAHGIFFVIFGILAIYLFFKDKKPFTWLLLVGLAALIPFGPFIFNKKINH